MNVKMILHDVFNECAGLKVIILTKRGNMLRHVARLPQFVPILLVVSTNSLLVLDQRTLQVKYRIPAHDIQRISLSPFLGKLPLQTLTFPCFTLLHSLGGCLGLKIKGTSMLSAATDG